MVMRENEIYKRVCDVVKTALSRLGLSGFDVMQQHQPVPTSSHSCILVTMVDSHRVGWQGVAYKKVDPLTVPTIWKRTVDGIEAELPEGYDANVDERWDYIDEAAFQVSGYHPRKVDASVGSVTAYDAVSAIATWVMSPGGNSYMRGLGFQPLRISEVRNPVSPDDSETPQFNPNFDMRFMIHQQIDVKTPMILGGRIITHYI